MRLPDEGTDRLLCLAIAERRLITFTLDGLRRIAEPHDYGIIEGVAKLFFYQIGGKSRSRPAVGWRWGVLTRISRLQILDDRFAGSRPAPSGRHIRWDTLIATVSERPASESSTSAAHDASHRTRPAKAQETRH